MYIKRMLKSLKDSIKESIKSKLFTKSEIWDQNMYAKTCYDDNVSLISSTSTYTFKEDSKIESKETDPNGFTSSTPGAKLDLNKPDLDLVLGDFAKAILEVGKVGTFGAKKYSRSGWLSVPNGIRRYSSALQRHWFYLMDGEEYDDDSGLHHAAHMAWNSLAHLELLLREKTLKDSL